MVKIRLRRMGSTHRPFYRVVVSDTRRVPTSSAIEEIGYYDPRQEPAVIEIKTERVEHWVGKGAQLSPTVKKLVKKARHQAQQQAAQA
jgi:small subunit ribosomal protein S16